MPIRIKCPKCQTALAVKDSLVGKKVGCPKCRCMLAIPVAKVAAPKQTTGPSRDVEAEALQAFADEPPKPEAVSTKTVEIECPFCMEMVKFSADLAGKQAPCPNAECKRIIKVPALKETKPKDWRQVDPRVAGGLLKTDAEDPGGGWSSAQKTRVSTEALEEANALPVRKQPVTRATWIRRGLLATVAVVLLGVGTWALLGWLSSGKMHGALNSALELTKANTKPARVAEIHRAAGEFHILAGEPGEASRHFNEARNKIDAAAADGNREAELVLIDLALGWFDLVEIKPHADATQKWTELKPELQRTVTKLGSVESKQIAIREIGTRLLGHKQYEIAIWLADQFAPPPAPFPVLQPDIALQDAKQDDPDKKKPTVPAVPRSPLAAQQIAFWVGIGKPTEALKIAPAPDLNAKEQSEIDFVTRVGYAEGKARQGDFAAARQIAKLKGSPLHRLDASLAIIAVALSEKKMDQAKDSLADALEAQDEANRRDMKPDAWSLIHLVRACSRLGKTAEANRVASTLSDQRDKDAKALAQMEQLAAYLAAASSTINAAKIDEFVTHKETLGYGLALEKAARHNTKLGFRSDALALLEGLDDSQKPFVWVGIALGLQDANK